MENTRRTIKLLESNKMLVIVEMNKRPGVLICRHARHACIPDFTSVRQANKIMETTV